jgi:hypothetical protein
MNKYLLTPIVLVLVGLVSGCTTERAAPPQTVIYQDKQPGGDSREAAREGAREGARDPYR